jgi:hypothetical protein
MGRDTLSRLMEKYFKQLKTGAKLPSAACAVITTKEKT